MAKVLVYLDIVRKTQNILTLKSQSENTQKNSAPKNSIVSYYLKEMFF